MVSLLLANFQFVATVKTEQAFIDNAQKQNKDIIVSLV